MGALIKKNSLSFWGGGQTFDLKNMIFIVFKGFFYEKGQNWPYLKNLKKLSTFQ